MSPLEQNASDSPVITDITAAADNADPEVGAAAVPDLPVDAQEIIPARPPSTWRNIRIIVVALLRYKFNTSHEAQEYRFAIRSLHSLWPPHHGPTARSNSWAAVATFAATWYPWAVLVAIILVIVGIVINKKVDRILGVLLACLGVIPAITLRIMQPVALRIVRSEMIGAMLSEREMEQGLVREFRASQRLEEGQNSVAGRASVEGQAAVDGPDVPERHVVQSRNDDEAGAEGPNIADNRAMTYTADRATMHEDDVSIQQGRFSNPALHNGGNR